MFTVRNYNLLLFCLLLILAIGYMFHVAGYMSHAAGYMLYETSPSLYFQTDTTTMSPGSEFKVKVLADSEQLINAVDIEIRYSPAQLEILSLNTANSVIDFWRNQSYNALAGVVRLEGGSPNPISGIGKEIAEIFFRAKTEGQVELRFRTANIYYADGLGTLADSESRPLTVAVSPSAPTLALTPIQDRNPPLLAEIQIIKSPVDNAKLAVFDITDKETGVKKTYLKELKWFSWSEWRNVVNPAKLTAGIWAFKLGTVDNQNNTAEKTVYFWPEIAKIIIFTLLFLVIIGVIIKLWPFGKAKS